MPEVLPDLYRSLYHEYQDTRTGIHVSDIVLCPRKRVFRELEPKPITNIELNFFSSGKAIHAALQSLVARYPDIYEIEHEIDYGGISGHIDIYNKAANIPIEAKSMRKADVQAPKPHHVRQLHAYMAITDAEQGIVLYQLLLHFAERPFVEFVVSMSADERQKMRDWLRVEHAELAIALRNKDPALARAVLLDPDYNFQCRKCPYLLKCQEITLRHDTKR